MSSMLLSLFATSDPVGGYSFVYLMTKRGSCSSKFTYWGVYYLKGSNPLRESIAFHIHCMMLYLNF